MHISQTVLGRWVRPQDRAEHEKDAILAALYYHHIDSSNTADSPLTLKGLSIATGMSERKVKDRLDVLVSQKLVKRVGGGGTAYRITGLGVEFVEKAEESTELDVE